MDLGIALRSMGPEAHADILVDCTRAAERAGLADVWIQDHIAIPPDDAEGSNGRYLDPLTTLAFLAGQTSRVGLGLGVLNLPYRPALPTAKALATVQELSGGRVRLGVGVGWMKAEFKALGIPRGERGRRTDETLDFIHRCFASDEVEANGQTFLFRPRPPRPPIFIGGAPPHALTRTVAHGEGWLPMGADPEALKEPISRLWELAEQAGRARPEVKVMTTLALQDPERAAEQIGTLAEAGVTSLVHATRYSSAAEFEDVADRLSGFISVV
jgi:probable F420-dependent oxidoreductase